MARWQEGHLTCIILILVIARSNLLKEVEEEYPKGNKLTKVHLEKCHLN